MTQKWKIEIKDETLNKFQNGGNIYIQNEKLNNVRYMASLGIFMSNKSPFCESCCVNLVDYHFLKLQI